MHLLRRVWEPDEPSIEIERTFFFFAIRNFVLAQVVVIGLFIIVSMHVRGSRILKILTVNCDAQKAQTK